MDIVVSFEDQSIVSDSRRGAPLVFGIAWEHEGTYYPSRDWQDFGAVIMVWWLAAASRLATEADEEDFLFMDGPYLIKARYDRQRGVVHLSPDGEHVTWRVHVHELAESLIRGTDAICERLAGLQLGEDDRASLNFGAAQLRRALSSSLNGA
jgi:hypothetical protein